MRPEQARRGWPRRARLICTTPSDDIGWISSGAGSPRNALRSASSSRCRSGLAGQIDEVDDDRATEIAQPNLTRDLARRSEVDIQGRPAATVDIDRDEGGSGLDQQPATARQRHLRAERRVQLRVDAGLRERRLVRVEAHRRRAGSVGVRSEQPLDLESQGAVGDSSCAGARSIRPRIRRASGVSGAGRRPGLAGAGAPRRAAATGRANSADSARSSLVGQLGRMAAQRETAVREQRRGRARATPRPAAARRLRVLTAASGRPGCGPAHSRTASRRW